MAHVPTEIRSHARSHALSALRSLATIAAKGESETARVNACIAILDRAYGKAPQAISGENGEGAIKVVIRHILDGKDVEPQLIEHRPIGREGEQDE